MSDSGEIQLLTLFRPSSKAQPTPRRSVLMDPISVDISDPVFVAGHSGLVGSALVTKLQSLGYTNLFIRTHSELNLTIQSVVDSFFAAHKPIYVILFAPRLAASMPTTPTQANSLPSTSKSRQM
ncbi:GDP-L-fucose synthase [Forsythia ovata]|uniref:GDP-L-fucose synthase n=1 Tax=Forsythia ovata TaxID=205694 RepID=A0ABD1TRM3_9LAMI